MMNAKNVSLANEEEKIDGKLATKLKSIQTHCNDDRVQLMSNLHICGKTTAFN